MITHTCTRVSCYRLVYWSVSAPIRAKGFTASSVVSCFIPIFFIISLFFFIIGNASSARTSLNAQAQMGNLWLVNFVEQWLILEQFRAMEKVDGGCGWKFLMDFRIFTKFIRYLTWVLRKSRWDANNFSEFIWVIESTFFGDVILHWAERFFARNR